MAGIINERGIRLPHDVHGARAYYNEIDRYAAAWLRNLIAKGLIADGYVDERDIREVPPSELAGYSQHHFFAGIGGWPLALRLAGWPDDRPVVTGSCPCQPFSAAGKGGGVRDERHLWPDFRWIIAKLRPAICFGEQVAGKDGRGWLAGVRADLEAMGYRVGAADLCSAGIGAPNIRQRLFWVADSRCEKLAGRTIEPARQERQASEQPGAACGLVDANRNGLLKRQSAATSARHGSATVTASCGGDREVQYIQRPWEASDYVHCADGKRRRIEPGSFPLAHGLPRSVGPGSTRDQRVELLAAKACRVGRLKGYGNAICPQLAAEFIAAFVAANQGGA